MRVGIVERHAFRMRTTVTVVVPGGENLAITYHHRADQRVLETAAAGRNK